MYPLGFDFSFDFSRTTNNKITIIYFSQPEHGWSDENSSPVIRDYSELIDERVRDETPPDTIYPVDDHRLFDEYLGRWAESHDSNSRKAFPVLDNENFRDTYC